MGFLSGFRRRQGREWREEGREGRLSLGRVFVEVLGWDRV